jgi:hypothetical protein
MRVAPIRQAVNKLKRWASRRPRRLFGLLAFVVLMILAAPNIFANRLESLFGCWRTNGLCSTADWLQHGEVLLGVLAVFALAFLALKELVATVVWRRMRMVTGRESQCRVLVTGLSEWKALDRAILDEIGMRFAGRAEDYALPTKEFTHRLAELGAPAQRSLATQWQQTVRAIFHHGDALERVLVLPSAESLAQWTQFKELMTALFPGLPVELVRGENGEPFRLPEAPGVQTRSYEDYSYLFEGLSRAVELLLAQAGNKDARRLSDKDICIDITAGPKTFSVAGAIVTLNRDLKLSYVSSEGTVTIFDAEIGLVDSVTRPLMLTPAR